MAGRPTKLTPKLIQAVRNMLSDDNLVLAYTNTDILEELNYQLGPGNEIGQRTFDRWITDKESELWQVIKIARKRTKGNLVRDLKKETRSWQRYAWLLERCYKDQFKETKEHEITGSITINLNLNKDGNTKKHSVS